MFFFLRELLCSPVGIILSMPYACLHLRVPLTGRTKERSLGALQKVMFFGKSESVEQKTTFISACAPLVTVQVYEIMTVEHLPHLGVVQSL